MPSRLRLEHSNENLRVTLSAPPQRRRQCRVTFDKLSTLHMYMRLWKQWLTCCFQCDSIINSSHTQCINVSSIGGKRFIPRACDHSCVSATRHLHPTRAHILKA